MFVLLLHVLFEDVLCFLLFILLLLHYYIVALFRAKCFLNSKVGVGIKPISFILHCVSNFNFGKQQIQYMYMYRY